MDIERVIKAQAAATGLAGLALGMFADKRFLVVPGVVAAMTLLHAVQGWYPLLPALRRAGLRTQHEIDRERFAMKAVRGDFEEAAEQRGESRAKAAWRAAGV